ncbi:MAG: hypothetical protein ACKPKO_08335 [Candidatus Fonsibacter sp.]
MFKRSEASSSGEGATAMEARTMEEENHATKYYTSDGKKFIYNLVGDYATMIHKGNHII